MIITELKRKTSFDLQSLLDLWLVPLPQHPPQARTHCVVGQKIVEVRITAAVTSEAIGFFNKPVGGELVLTAKSNPAVDVGPGDIVIYTIHWECL